MGNPVPVKESVRGALPCTLLHPYRPVKHWCQGCSTGVRATFRQGAPPMASQISARHSARVVIFLVAAFLLAWASVDARAQGKGNATTTSTNGNSSWEQAIAALQAKVDQLTATIAQLQTALAAETTARQTG